jgi:CRP-like cAMP-binding protein
MDRLEELRAQWHKASEKDKQDDAVKALLELEKLEANEPRWSQRLGESYRRLGKTEDAVEAFARAFDRYFARGFLPRAIAMAKLVKSLDAARGDLLEASLPKGGPGVPPPLPFGRTVGTPPPRPVPVVPTPAKNVVKPPPLPAGAGPKPPRAPAAAPTRPTAPPPLPAEPLPLVSLKAPSVKPPPLPPPPVRPAILMPADDSMVDEIRFSDAPDSSIEILLVDFNNASAIARIEADDDDAPPTRPLEPGMREEPALDAYATMATFRLFASLSRDALVALSNAAELVEFVPGAMIIVRDERAFALYAIVSGRARVTVTGANAEFHLDEGDIFGEASLLDEGQRQADVRAETPLMTLRIEKRALDEVIREYPEVEGALFDLLARRLITNLMHTSPLFNVFEPQVRLELAQKFEVRRAPAGTVIAERGRRSDGLYVLLAGNVQAESGSAGTPPTRIARGTAFGHSSLLGSSPADTTVRAASEAVLLRMPATGFGALAALYPPALAHLAETANEPLPMSRR